MPYDDDATDQFWSGFHIGFNADSLSAMRHIFKMCPSPICTR